MTVALTLLMASDAFEAQTLAASAGANNAEQGKQMDISLL